MSRQPRRELYGPRFDGAREIDRMLRETDTSLPVFCEAHGIDRWILERVVNGRAKRAPDADLVLAVQTATDGRVNLAMWAMSTLREDEPGEVVPVEPKSGPVLPETADVCSTGT